jgi:hypothetical protein
MAHNFGLNLWHNPDSSEGRNMKDYSDLEVRAHEVAQNARSKEYARVMALIDSAAPATEQVPVTKPFSDEPTGDTIRRHQTEGERLKEQQVRLTFAKMIVADLCGGIEGDREAVLAGIRDAQSVEANIARNSLARTALDILEVLKTIAANRH